MIIGLGRDRYGRGKPGHRIRVSPRDKTPQCQINNLPKGVIVRRRKETMRKDGSYLKFSDNAFVVIHKNKAKGTKIKGPLPLEVQHNVRNLARWIF